ncbi:MAG: Lrp/AsnC family transcriptional regulator [Candidatus Hermodarchaeota archaeon]
MTETIELDELDKQILSILQNNAKASLRDIEREIQLTPTSIRMRINRLKEKKVIKQYVTLIDCRYLGYDEMVMASLRVNSSFPLDDIKRKLELLDKIKYAYIITGEYPLFIMAKCMNHQDSMDLIEKLRNLPGVEEVKTQIVLDKIKEDPSVIIPK